MKREDDGPFADPVGRKAFVRDLERRGRAARGLETDLLHEVPLLYGSVGEIGDPGIELARVHRGELLRRNGGGVLGDAGEARRSTLPFERGLWVFLIIGMVARFVFG